jgi:hypothetical protein
MLETEDAKLRSCEKEILA